MNERIKELAGQSKPTDENGQKVRGLNSEYHNQWMEKFAELIVKECLELVNGMADPEDSERYFWAIQNVSKKIEEHFGVEE